MGTDEVGKTAGERDARPTRWWLALILLLAVWTGWSHIRVQGLMTWDDGVYYDEARFVVQAAHAMRTHGSIAETTTGFPPRMGRPLNTALNAAAMMALGPQRWVPAALAGLFGVLCVYATYLLGRGVMDERAGLLAAALVTLSPYFLQYRRMGLPEAAGTFAALLILIRLVNLREREERRPWLNSLGLGLVMGAAFTINMRLAVLLPVAMLFRIVWLGGGRDWRRIVGHLAVMALGIFVLVGGFEIPYRLLPMHVAVPVALESYWQQLGRFIWTQQSMGQPPLHLGYLAPFVFLGYFEAPVLVLATIAVFAQRVGRSSKTARLADVDLRPTRLLIACILAQVLVMGFVAPFARYLSWVLPLLMILAAWAICQADVLLQSRARKALVLIALIIIAGHGLYRARPMLRARGAMPQAVFWLLRNEVTSVVASNASIAMAYAPNVHQLPADTGEAYELIERLSKQGQVYVLLDRQQFIRGTFVMSEEEYRGSAAGAIAFGAAPVWKHREFSNLFMPFAFEHNRDILQTLRAARVSGRGERLAIYDGLDALMVLSVAD